MILVTATHLFTMILITTAEIIQTLSLPAEPRPAVNTIL